MASSNSVPTKHDFKHKEGDTFNPTFTFTLAGEPSDMTGVVPELIIDAADIDNLTLSDGLEWGTGGNAHKLYVSKLWNYPVGRYSYELQLTFPSGEVKTPFAGKIIIEAQIVK